MVLFKVFCFLRFFLASLDVFLYHLFDSIGSICIRFCIYLFQVFSLAFDDHPFMVSICSTALEIYISTALCLKLFSFHKRNSLLKSSTRLRLQNWLNFLVLEAIVYTSLNLLQL